jgi:hypothetical protein
LPPPPCPRLHENEAVYPTNIFKIDGKQVVFTEARKWIFEKKLLFDGRESLAVGETLPSTVFLLLCMKMAFSPLFLRFLSILRVSYIQGWAQF